MRSWLTYIFLSMVACATVLTSCNNVLDEEGIAECDDRTTVRLTISFGGDGGPMSRDVENNPAPKDDDLDYTTEAQAEIVAEDIYALVVDASGKFLYRIKDLTIDGPANDDYYTRTLEGTMIQTNQQVKIVLLANLIQNKITVNSTALDSKSNVETFIDGYEGQNVDVNTIYNQLIYNYDETTTPWSLTGDNARRIPMWGESQPTTVPPTENIDLACYLYRALAKVQIWVNMKNGIDGFVINSITVKNIHTKGYCVSQATEFNEDGPNYDVNNDGKLDVLPYTKPSVPDNPGTQSVSYSPLDEDVEYEISYGKTETYNQARESFSDMIYLPEQVNIKAETPVTITVNYTYNGIPDVGIIRFTEGGVEDQSKAFDIIRNHSYIFNIASVNTAEDVQFTLQYQVIDWTSITNPTLNFGNGNGNVNQ